jgi:hypothetical protein
MLLDTTIGGWVSQALEHKQSIEGSIPPLYLNERPEMRKTLLALILTLCIPSMAFCASGDLFSVEDPTYGQEVRILKTGEIVGAKANYELVATNDTVTAAESGKTFVVKQSSADTTNTVTLTLPSAVAGLSYTIISADDEIIYVDPAGTDTIIYKNPPMGGGDKLQSPAATGDSVILVCPATGYWAATTVGTWLDAN